MSEPVHPGDDHREGQGVPARPVTNGLICRGLAKLINGKKITRPISDPQAYSPRMDFRLGGVERGALRPLG